MDHDLIVVVSVETERLVMTVAGDLTGTRHRALVNAVDTLDRVHGANRHLGDVVVDVGRVQEVDAGGARALTEAGLRLTSQGLRVILEAVSFPLQTLLEAGEAAEASALLSGHTERAHRSGHKRS